MGSQKRIKGNTIPEFTFINKQEIASMSRQRTEKSFDILARYSRHLLRRVLGLLIGPFVTITLGIHCKRTIQISRTISHGNRSGSLDDWSYNRLMLI